VTFSDNAVNDAGKVQLPFVPNVVIEYVSAAPNGVVRVPTADDARVSMTRHGAMAVKADGLSLPEADAPSSPPPPKATAYE
jgi:hypothetical protein